MRTLLVSLLVPPALAAASPPAAETAVADTLAKAVDAAGLRDPKALQIRFTFRGTPYRLWLDGRHSIYVREVTGPNGAVRVDRLEGDAFTVQVDGQRVALPPDEAGALRRSLNSVAYFALLPRPLEDEAVIATSLGVTELGGQPWDTVEVRFREEGGGDDHDDVFRYWLHPETHRIGYLAYTFATGKGGVRVRRATRYHEVGGVVLVDWVNHGRNGPGLSIDDAVGELEAGTLPELSTIELQGLRVERGVPAPRGDVGGRQAPR